MAVTVPPCEGLPEAEVARKEVLLAPAGIVTAGGTVSAGLSLEIETGNTLGAALVSATEQVVDEPATRVVGEQVSEERRAGPSSVTDADLVTPLAVADTVALTSAGTAAAVAVNVAAADPEPMVMESGTEKPGRLLESVTRRLAEASMVNVTVQVVEPGVGIDEGEQLRLLRVAGGRTVRAADWLTPWAEAVTVTACCEATVPAVAAKLAVVAPEGTVMEAGTGKAVVLLELRATTKPLAAAGLLSVTVQVVEAPAVRVEGRQVREVRVTGASRVREADTEPPFQEAVI
jgi:hypothetical protein